MTSSPVDLGTYDLENCTAEDDNGVILVCDPRSWVLWIYAVWNGLTFRSSPYGTEVWVDGSGGTYDYTVVKHSALGDVGTKTYTPRTYR